mgnify:CR=1 FL=1
MPNTSKEGILFLFEGDRPAGYCWTVVVPSDNGPRGIIGLIGVVPEYRGKPNRKMCSLFLSMMGKCGINLKEFGDSTEHLAEV